MPKKSITFGAAIKWLHEKKEEAISDNRLTLAYNGSMHKMDLCKADIESADYEMLRYSNSIATLKDAIVAVRGEKKLADALVIEMNKKIEKHNEWGEKRNDCIVEYQEAQRLVENYDRDTEKELFFFWQLLHDLLPEQTPNWTDFKHEHKDFFYKYRYEQSKN